MNFFLNLSLLVFLVGVFTFFIKKFPLKQNLKIAKVFLILGIIFLILYFIEIFKILDFAGVYSQNIFYGLSLSSLLLSFKFGIKNIFLKIFSWLLFVINIPLLHIFFLILFSFLLNIQLYEIPKIIKQSQNYRIKSENNALGISMNENVFYIKEKFPFEKKFKLFNIPRSEYIDSLRIIEKNNKIHIRYLGKDSLDIDTTFNIK